MCSMFMFGYIREKKSVERAQQPKHNNMAEPSYNRYYLYRYYMRIHEKYHGNIGAVKLSQKYSILFSSQVQQK